MGLTAGRGAALGKAPDCSQVGGKREGQDSTGGGEGLVSLWVTLSPGDPGGGTEQGWAWPLDRVHSSGVGTVGWEVWEQVQKGVSARLWGVWGWTWEQWGPGGGGSRQRCTLRGERR